MIIDVGTHWESVSRTVGEHPLDVLRDLPSAVDMLAFGVACGPLPASTRG